MNDNHNQNIERNISLFWKHIKPSLTIKTYFHIMLECIERCIIILFSQLLRIIFITFSLLSHNFFLMKWCISSTIQTRIHFSVNYEGHSPPSCELLTVHNTQRFHKPKFSEHHLQCNTCREEVLQPSSVTLMVTSLLSSLQRTDPPEDISSICLFHLTDIERTHDKCSVHNECPQWLYRGRTGIILRIKYTYILLHGKSSFSCLDIYYHDIRYE